MKYIKMIENKLTPRDCIVLEGLLEGDKCPTELAKMCESTTAAITLITDKLLFRRLITREQNPKDRRRFIISVTDKGRELINE
jgi:DNA-binding MarR family transcriptional regulator